MATFILFASLNGKTVYWTGKAGAAWVSENKAEAFRCLASLAQRKLQQHNRFSSLHGLTFKTETVA